VFTSIYGTPFCYSGWTAFKLVTAKLGRSVMVDAVSKYTRVFGRWAITLMNTAIGAMVMYWNSGFQNDLSALFLPTMIILIVTYCVATLFMEVFDIAVESVYLCFLVDEKVHSEPRFAGEDLKGIVATLPEQLPTKKDEVAGDEDAAHHMTESMELGRTTTDVATEV